MKLKKKHTGGDDVASSSGGEIIDPLADLNVDIQTFDIPRKVSIYPDKFGIHWWTKAWFNNKKKGEAAVEITRLQAIAFINDNIVKNDWLEQYFPRQMEVYHKAMAQTREQIIKSMQ